MPQPLTKIHAIPASANMGLSDHIEIEVYPLASLTLEPFQGKRVDDCSFKLADSFEVKGQCDLLPDSCPADLEMLFLSDETGKTPMRHVIKVKLKVDVPFKTGANFRLKSPVTIDMIKYGFVGTGELRLRLRPAIEFCQVTEDFPIVLKVHLPYALELSKRGAVQLGETLTLSAPNSLVYKHYDVTVLVLQTFDSNDRIKESEQIASLVFLAGTKTVHHMQLGLAAKHISAINTLSDCKFEIKYFIYKPIAPNQKVPEKRKAEFTAIIPKVWTAPFPKLEKLEVAIRNTRFDFTLKWAEFWEMFSKGNRNVSHGDYVIEVSGALKNWPADLAGTVDTNYLISLPEIGGQSNPKMGSWMETRLNANGSFASQSGFISQAQWDQFKSAKAELRGLMRLAIQVVSPDKPSNKGLDHPDFLSLSDVVGGSEACKSAIASNAIDLDGQITRIDIRHITLQELQALGAKAIQAELQKFVQPLNEALGLFQIDSPLRKAHFFAQAMHESGGMARLKEAGKTDPYCGRGLIQLTGKGNYQSFQNMIRSLPRYASIDLLKQPDNLLEPELACLSAAWYWHTGYRKGPNSKDPNGNTLAAQNDFLGITQNVIRPSSKAAHHQERFNYLKKAFEVFGIPNAEATLKVIAKNCRDKNVMVS